MKLIPMTIAACLVATAASAQSTAPSDPAVRPAPGATVKAPDPASSGAMKATGGADQGAASGNGNQSVATTDANAMQPAKGANSFTAGEAQKRLEREGYTTVADLKKDDDGIWRGHGTKDGASVNVWLDYKGNIGRQ